jgi:hypothetical protein
MRTAARICKWLGHAWIIIAVIFILLNYASIWYFEGWGVLQEIASPFNIWNYIAVVITLAPGIGLSMLADYLNRRRASP